MTSLPILWSFRRCPYAMRARLAIASSGVQVELREILLRDKPEAFRAASPTATVPCLQLPDRVIDESFDIMRWVLAQHDPEHWLEMPDEGYGLIAQCDGPFKHALDRVKYASRYPDHDPGHGREQAMAFLADLDVRLVGQGFLMGPRRTLADMAILPFVRQFAAIDRAWFDAQGMGALTSWLDDFLQSNRLSAIMTKYPPWQSGQDAVIFPAINSQGHAP